MDSRYSDVRQYVYLYYFRLRISTMHDISIDDKEMADKIFWIFYTDKSGEIENYNNILSKVNNTYKNCIIR